MGKFDEIRRIMKDFKGDVDGLANAYVATQTLLVNMFRANSEPIWKISKQTETVMRKILSQ